MKNPEKRPYETYVGQVPCDWKTGGAPIIAQNDKLRIGIHNIVKNHPETGKPLYNFPLLVEERTVGIAALNGDRIGVISINRAVFPNEKTHDRFIGGEALQDCIGSQEIETPRGMAKSHETFEEAGIREVQEEVRKKVMTIRLAGQYQFNSTFIASAPALLVAHVSDEDSRISEDATEFISKIRFIHVALFFELIRRNLIKDGFAQALSSMLLLEEYKNGIPPLTSQNLSEETSQLQGLLPADTIEQIHQQLKKQK